jgi:ketosteroid isomerase-like protein
VNGHLSGTGSDGNPVDMAAKSADVLRHQADGTWQFVIDNHLINKTS